VRDHRTRQARRAASAGKSAEPCADKTLPHLPEVGRVDHRQTSALLRSDTKTLNATAGQILRVITKIPPGWLQGGRQRSVFEAELDLGGRL
jgi:hypothetical protein